MPRSFGGGRVGSFSSGSSPPDTRKNVVMSSGLSAASKNIGSVGRSSNSCHIAFDLYEECVKTEHRYPGSCDYYRNMMESCSGYQKDPSRRSIIEVNKEWEESTKKTATAAGFATIDGYLRDKQSKSASWCSIAFKLYEECIREHPTNKQHCEAGRLDCKEFKS